MRGMVVLDKESRIEVGQYCLFAGVVRMVQSKIQFIWKLRWCWFWHLMLLAGREERTEMIMGNWPAYILQKNEINMGLKRGALTITIIAFHECISDSTVVQWSLQPGGKLIKSSPVLHS